MSFHPTQTGLCKFRWVWTSLRRLRPPQHHKKDTSIPRRTTRKVCFFSVGNASFCRKKHSEVPKCGRSKRGRMQTHGKRRPAKERRRAQKSAKGRKRARKSAKGRKRAQKNAKNSKQSGLKQPGLGTPKESTIHTPTPNSCAPSSSLKMANFPASRAENSKSHLAGVENRGSLISMP